MSGARKGSGARKKSVDVEQAVRVPILGARWRTSSPRRFSIVTHAMRDRGTVPDSKSVTVVAGVWVLCFDAGDKISA